MKISLLRTVARAYGIQCSYRNVNGETVWSPEKTLVKLLSDLSRKKICEDKDLENLWEEKIQQRYLCKLPPSMVFWGGKSKPINIYHFEELENITGVVCQKETKDEFKINFEKIRSTKSKHGFKTVFRVVEKLPVGYFDLKIKINGEYFESLIISAPEKLDYEHKKSWGAFVPLYAVHSNNDWGIGSFKEMQELAFILKKYDAKWIGLLPMLAANFDHVDCDPSPYSSLSRLFWNEIYLDVEELVNKYQLNDLKLKINSAEFQNKLKILRETEYVNYYEVYKLKKEILMDISISFFKLELNNEKAYKEFLHTNTKLTQYSNFRSGDSKEQNYHCFVQYEMYLALLNFKEKTGLDLYMDYPVGVNDSGFDYQEFREVFFGEVSVGAPPEPVFALGQDWGFPAFHPVGMIKDQYQYFIQSLRHHLKFSKILRLDHIMGLYRIYCVPKKFKGDEGVYLRYPKEDLFAIVVTEAFNHQADLIGENLGTVPNEVQKILDDRNINGMWVFQCETWKKPELAFDSIKSNSLVCVNTHDMPMLQSYKEGTDLDKVHSLNILSLKYKEIFSKERVEQITIWENSLTKLNFLENLLKKVGSSNGKYLVVNLEDLMGETRPQNIPGTWKEYPNWRKKFLLPLEKMESSLGKYFQILKESRHE